MRLLFFCPLLCTGCPPTCTDPDYSLRPDAKTKKEFLESYASPLVDEDEVEYFVLVNHLYWGLWAINQSAAEGNDVYNYGRYATNRIAQYFVDKKVHTCEGTTEAASAAVMAVR